MSNRYTELDLEAYGVMPDKPVSETLVTVNDIVPGDVIRFVGHGPWWTVTQTERGTDPQMVNLWMVTFVQPSNTPGMGSWPGTNPVFRVNNA